MALGTFEKAGSPHQKQTHDNQTASDKAREAPVRCLIIVVVIILVCSHNLLEFTLPRKLLREHSSDQSHDFTSTIRTDYLLYLSMPCCS